MSRTVFSLIQDCPALAPDTPGSTVYQMFSEDADLLACAVVEDGRPLGLVSRNAFFVKMADVHGRALYAKRPITRLMQADPLIVESSSPVEIVSEMIVTDRPSALFEGFVIVSEGLYAGVGTGAGLLKAVHEEAEQRNRRLVTQSEQLGRMRIEALTASRAKTEFLATMSHEIRTPLNGVLGLTQLLLESDLADEQRRMANTIQSSGEILLRLLNDVLDLSKIEAGKMDIEPVDFDLSELVAGAGDLWSPRARQKGLDFTVTLDAGDSLWITSDPVRIKQILFNLISNAIKFTEAGAVEASVSVVALMPGRSILRGEVRDSGPGIPQAARERLFQAFSQADASTTRLHGGTGLGLTICKRLAELFDGTIGFDSKPGAGARFWFEIPVKAASEAAVETNASFEDAGVCVAGAPRILAAEDNPVNQEVLAGFLALRGWRCDFADSGEEAMSLVRTRAYELVLMDIHMPGMDGLETTRRLRAGEKPGARLPVIALTADAGPGDRLRCAAAGMDGYVAKPIMKAALFAEIDRVLDRYARTLGAA